MVLEFFSSPVGIAAILSFFIGSFGYVIAKMWVQPLLRYRLLKSRVRALLDTVELLPAETITVNFPAAQIRKTAGRLADCHNKTLPQWYQLMLTNRKESPETAVAELMVLANVKNQQHALSRIANVRAALQIKP